MDESSKHQRRIDLSSPELNKYFWTHLNKVYCAKRHLLSQLPQVADIAKFSGLKDVIAATTSDVARQLQRIEQIYVLLDQTYHDEECRGLIGLIDEVFGNVDKEHGNKKLQDMAIIYYLQNIESLEMASLQTLQLAAVKFGNEAVNALLKETFNDIKGERDMLLLLSAKYLTN